MKRRLLQLVPFGLILLALGLPVLATAESGDPAEQEAKAKGFDLQEEIGDDVTLVESGPGEKLFRVELGGGEALTTHGPDRAPQAGEHGASLAPGDPERAPVCATDDVQHVLYGVPAGQTNRYASVVADIRASMKRSNAVLNSESLESGGPELDYRVLCDPGGEIRVDTFVGPAGDDSFGAVANAASSAGFDDPGTKYSIFYDTDASGGYCGIGSMYWDERAGAENANNGTTSDAAFAVTHRGCWSGLTPMHENGHNMGAVQQGAPKSTGDGGHCFQDHDVMCYSPDGGDRNQQGAVYDCTDHLHFDCGHDDFFDSSPESGEWLATHWNVGSEANRFLARGAGGSEEPPNRAPVAGDDAANAEKNLARDPGVLANDADPDGDPLNVVAVTDPAHGTASVQSGGGGVRYTPDRDFTGTDSLEYTVADGRGGTDTAEIAITVRDTVRPVVQTIAPADRATGVSPAANATVRFSETMRAATIDGARFTLTRAGTTTAVPATVRYAETSRTATLDPGAALARGATYRARVLSGARDTAGNALSPGRTWSFTVRR